MKLSCNILIIEFTLSLLFTSCINGDNVPVSGKTTNKEKSTTYTILYNEDSTFQAHYKNWKSNIIISEYSGGKIEPRENKIENCHDGIKIVCTANSITDYITIHINRIFVNGDMTEILSPWFYDPKIILKNGMNTNVVINGDTLVGYKNLLEW
jgi:hypothetical protein